MLRAFGLGALVGGVATLIAVVGSAMTSDTAPMLNDGPTLIKVIGYGAAVGGVGGLAVRIDLGGQ